MAGIVPQDVPIFAAYTKDKQLCLAGALSNKLQLEGATAGLVELDDGAMSHAPLCIGSISALHRLYIGIALRTCRDVLSVLLLTASTRAFQRCLVSAQLIFLHVCMHVLGILGTPGLVRLCDS